MFTEQQKAALAAPLNSSHVKGRNQGSKTVSYIEGWHVIAEANRIFGFDAWSRQTSDLKCVSEREREIGKDKAPGWGVTYIASVRVTVQAGELCVIREGSGTGHGIDRDLGQAHESALKEAETDAMKRALMTFGNPFGLALYDKQQTNVTDDSRPAPAPAPTTSILAEPAASAEADKLTLDVNGCVTFDELEKFIRGENFQGRVSKLPDKHRGRVRIAYLERGKKLKPSEQAA